MKVAAILACLLCVGCLCTTNTNKVRDSMKSVQEFYDPLVDKFLDAKTDAALHLAVLAADSALALAGKLQTQWCPSPAEVKKAELLATDAKNRAAAVGVVKK